MDKKYGIFVICTAILFMSFVGNASAKTWYVDNDGGADFTKIQDAIDAASPGDTVFVWNGTYYTDGVNISKNWIKLQGEDVNTTTIHGKWSVETVVSVTGDYVSVSDFTVANSSESGRGIYVNGDNCLISENVLEFNNIGISVTSSNNCSIENNIANSNINAGIQLLEHSNNSKIENNVANSNGNGISVTSSNNCSIESNIANTNTGYGIRLYSSDNCNVINNTANSNSFYAIELDTIYNGKIENNVANSNGNGIRVASSDNCSIESNIANTNTGSGIRLYSSDNCNVINITANSNSGYGIDLRYSSNGKIENNVANSNFHGIRVASSDNCSIVSNIANTNTGYGIRLYSSDNCNVINNTANNATGPGINLYSSTCCNVINNTANSNSGYGIYLRYSSNGKIENNVANSNANGIHVASSNNYNIESNIANSNMGYGIELDTTHNGKIKNNVANSNGNGVNVASSGNCSIESNIANTNTGYGIRLYSSDNCNVINNIVDTNKVGIKLVSTSIGNNIAMNNITKNKEYGIYLNRSGNNEVYHNNFIDNNKQAYEHYGCNNWNKGPLIGGNYWSDHVCHGNPSDGTEPYTNIDTNIDSEDKYPFEDPDGWVMPPPPKIMSNAPESPVNDVEGATRTFNVTVNQTVNVSWQINGTEVQLNESVTSASFMNTSAVLGTWNVSAIVANANGTDMQTWDWIVTKVTLGAPEITSYAPETPVNDIEGVTRTFNVTVNQTVNVSWQINGTEVQLNEGVTEATYTNQSAAEGTWYVSAIVTNANGADIQVWVWNVTSKENQPPVANFTYLPANPVMAQSITFNASNSTDPDGNITNYEWGFGDSGNTTNTTEQNIIHTYASAGTFTVTLTVTDDDGATNATSRAITVSEGLVFDTGTGTYPSIAGTHNGTITTNVTITVSKLCTYPCAGTGGHTEHVIITNNTGVIIAEADWDGYQVDGHNITFDVPFELVANETYRYSIRTGSYPQIIHADSKAVAGGTITCTSFVDTNGNTYTDWMPAIRLGN
ncbi:PKD repeat-containing protein [Candidatus Methanophagaceae archaeon]|nr:PKD repeat-containing protein [Methanophagales archaeon]